MLKFLRSLFHTGNAERKYTKAYEPRGTPERKGEGHIRSAGKDAMRDPPRRWDKRDEASDESFPASDPIAKY
jgi:hypothetical protein